MNAALSPEPTPLSTPTPEPERIRSLDVLRGVAVLGILVMNIQSFSMIGAAYMNPTAYGDLEGVNFLVWLGSHLLADQKFMTIFSILFGAGIVLMSDRLNRTGAKPAGRHYRRMAWLAVFGLLHAHLLWFGDILFSYAICGMILFPLRSLSPRIHFIIGAAMLVVPSLAMSAMGLSLPFWPESKVAVQMAEWAPGAEKISEELATYRGGWFQQFPHRSELALQFQVFFFPLFAFWRAGGLMLIGMALYRWGVLSAQRSGMAYGRMVGIGLVVGLPIIVGGVVWNFAQGWDLSSMFLGMQFNYWASLFVSAAWIGVVMLVCRRWGGARWLRPLAATGQMALTNYLMQTIICTTIFYGHGLGYFGEFSRVQQVLTVLGVWAFQLAASPLWLANFRYGPFEWLWRCLTYGGLQPLRRAALAR